MNIGIKKAAILAEAKGRLATAAGSALDYCNGTFTENRLPPRNVPLGTAQRVQSIWIRALNDCLEEITHHDNFEKAVMALNDAAEEIKRIAS